MQENIEIIIKKYENQECFTSDFFIEPKAKKAYSGEKEPVERLIKHLEINHPGQIEFIGRLKKHLLPEPVLTQVSEPILVTEPMVEHVPEPVSESKPIQEPSQTSKPMTESELDTTHKPVPEAAEEQIESDDTSSQERQYHAGMEYEINPDDKVDIHPAANIMPMMSEEQFKALKASIQKNGRLQDPIEMLEGKLLDGRNRLKACQELGIVAHAVEVECSAPNDYVISRNATRRQLNANQLAVIAVRQKEHLMQGFIPSKNLKTRDFLAKTIGVNPRYIQDVLRFKDDEETLNKIFNGELNIAQAKKLKNPPKQEKSYWGDEVVVSKLLEEYPEEKCDKLVDIVTHSKGRVRDVVQDKVSSIAQARLRKKSEELQSG